MTLRAWAELLRVSALFTVPGDALAGAASAGIRPNRGTALAVGASLCLYEAGMALNDWADRDEDAVERPHRPIPSGRVTPNAALAAAGGLTAAGLLLASRAGRPALALSTALAATVWAYDLRLKHTAAGPAAMGAARALDVLLGAAATRSAVGGGTGPAPRGRTTTQPLASKLTGSATRPTSRPTTPPAGRGVLARLSAWAGGSAGRGRTAAEAATSAAPRDTACRSARPGRTATARAAIWAGGPAEPLASRPAAPATGIGRATPPPARPALPLLSAWVGDSAVSTRRTPPTPQGLLAGLSAWAGSSAAERGPDPGGRLPVLRQAGRTAASLAGPAEALAAKVTGSVGRPPAPPAWRGAALPSAVPRGALAPAALLGAHTLAVTTVSRREVYGGSVGAPLAALAVTGVLGALVGLPRTDTGPPGLVTPALAAAFVVTAGQPLLHAALNPSPQLTQRAVGGGIRAMIPFQAALAARGGAPGIGLAVMGLVPLARKLAKRVSVT